jgi:hypothetical protein
MNTGGGKKSRWQDVAQTREVTLGTFAELRVFGSVSLSQIQICDVVVVCAAPVGLVGMTFVSRISNDFPGDTGIQAESYLLFIVMPDSAGGSAQFPERAWSRKA